MLLSEIICLWSLGILALVIFGVAYYQTQELGSAFTAGVGLPLTIGLMMAVGSSLTKEGEWKEDSRVEIPISGIMNSGDRWYVETKHTISGDPFYSIHEVKSHVEVEALKKNPKFIIITSRQYNFGPDKYDTKSRIEN